MRKNWISCLLVCSTFLLNGCTAILGFGQDYTVKVTFKVEVDGQEFFGSGVYREELNYGTGFAISRHLRGGSVSESFPIQLSNNQYVFLRPTGPLIRNFSERKSGESDKKYIRRIRKNEGVYNVDSRKNSKKFPYKVICFSDNWEFGIGEMEDLKAKQIVCGINLKVKSITWQLTDEAYTTGEAMKVIGEAQYRLWKEEENIRFREFTDGNGTNHYPFVRKMNAAFDRQSL